MISTQQIKKLLLALMITGVPLSLVLGKSITVGDGCGDPLDISTDVAIDDPFGYAFTLDVSNSTQYVKFTASETGTLEFDKGYSDSMYLQLLDVGCNPISDSIELWYSYDLHRIFLEEDETVVLACLKHESGDGFLSASAYFQSEVGGEAPEDPLDLSPGTNMVTRYLGNQYFVYQQEAEGWLIIKTCVDGSYADGTNLTLYGDADLETILAEDSYCSNDDEAIQSILEYEILETGGEAILEVSAIPLYRESYEFEVNFQAYNGSTCELAIPIDALSTYDVDNADGDQWFAFTAPETAEVSITTGPHAVGWGDVDLSNGQDTKLRVYDSCNGTLLAESDDSAIVNWRRSYATLQVTAGDTYLIQWMDQFVTTPYHYQFEIFKIEDILGNSTEDDAEVIDVGVHRAFLNYKDHHWFKYIFPSDGVLVGVNRDELQGRAIPSYEMLYGDNGLDLELPYEEEISTVNWSDSEHTETNFMLEGSEGEEVLIRVEEVAGIYFYSVGNRDFELAFFDGAAYNDLCYYEAELTDGTYEINSIDGDQKYKYTAKISGTHTFSADDNPSILISVYDQCFGDALYSKYNDFYYEKEMEAGEEVYFVFLDEFGGACDFEIEIQDCDNCNQWLGTNANWFDAANWSEGTVPDENDLVFIGVTDYDPVLVGDGILDSLFITGSATMTIESGSSLTVSGTVEGEGEVIVRRNTVGDAGYSIIGSPIMDAQIEELEIDYLYAFDGINYQVPTGERLIAGQGYFAAFNATEPVVEFKGQLNYGAITHELDQAGVFQLLANPYAAAISKDQFMIANWEAIGSTIYLWDDGGVNDGSLRGGGFVTVSSIGVTGNSGLKGPDVWTGNIPSMQGFYVYAEQAGTITFDPSHQVSDPGSNADTGYYRTSNAVKTIRLTLSNDRYEDDLLIGLTKDASLGLDPGLDARKLRNNHLSFFSIAESEELTVQAIPTGLDHRIDLGAVVPAPGTYEIALTEAEQINGHTALLLFDNLTEELHDLRSHSVVTNIITSEERGRFQLLIAEEILSVDKSTPLSLSPTTTGLTIHYEAGEEQVLISTVEGKICFYDKVDFRSGKVYIDQPFSNGIRYIVRIGNKASKFLIQK